MWMSWRAATERALYAKDGFYRSAGQPARHFRTSVHASPRFAAALLSLMPDAASIVDVGAGDGGLLAQLDTDARLIAVEKAPRPADLPARIEWVAELPDEITGLVIANEWLDNIPVDVVELASDGPHLVEVSRDGTERLGGPPDEADVAWLERWWPLAEEGQRAEIGRPRDEAWADLVKRVHRGVVVAADYGHTLDSRPFYGSLTGYRQGRQVAPVPDGSCDITAHVALDSCAAAVPETGLTTQRDALRSLGIIGKRPPIELARADPQGYLRELQRAGEEAELIDRHGLGSFGWLVHSLSAKIGL
ncbi:SAM-dependent methyltransferase [Kibdelosporangium philippinense]|uniref:SAM-dependent methyltransferase n=1 Tax=Kibdelosporangium philippinense TaxID=211113 RepID=A0ABS8Z4I1_9PSEU|nr:SAM-dependent methyltransferase [Kibdelosporangium philippinense]MCE7002745.1 SAM-dependent methyltransferase [Kibdelosporangium philippinense]